MLDRGIYTPAKPSRRAPAAATGSAKSKTAQTLFTTRPSTPSPLDPVHGGPALLFSLFVNGGDGMRGVASQARQGQHLLQAAMDGAQRRQRAVLLHGQPERQREGAPQVHRIMRVAAPAKTCAHRSHANALTQPPLPPYNPPSPEGETATPPLPLRRRASRAQLKGVVPLKAGSVKVDPLGSLRIALHVFGERTYTFEALDGAGYDKWVLALRGALPESPSGVDTHPRTALPTSGESAEPRTPSTMEPIFPDVSDTPVAPPPDAAADASPDAAADAAPLWHRAVRLQAQMGDQINIHGNLGATSPGAAAAAAWDDAHLPSAPSTPSREAAEGALSPPSPPASATGHSLPPASTLAVATPPSEAAHAVATLSPVGASIPERGGFTPAGRLVWLPVDDEDAWVRSSRRQPLPSLLAPPAAPVAPPAAVLSCAPSRSSRSSMPCAQVLASIARRDGGDIVATRQRAPPGVPLSVRLTPQALAELLPGTPCPGHALTAGAHQNTLSPALTGTRSSLGHALAGAHWHKSAHMLALRLRLRLTTIHVTRPPPPPPHRLPPSPPSRAALQPAVRWRHQSTT